MKLFLTLIFFSFYSWGEIQYKPLSSIERHEVSFGYSVAIKDWKNKKTLEKKLPVVSLNYSLYFPEISHWIFPDNFKNLLILSVSGTGNKLRGQKTYGICGTNTDRQSSMAQFGFKIKSALLETFQPFVEWGWAKPFCHSKNFSEFDKPEIQFKSYLSYGFFVSFKLIDRHSIYALDQDYGVNDLGLKMECLQYNKKTESHSPRAKFDDLLENALQYNKKTESHSPLIHCQLGLKISF